jgi:predicted N-acetyltransferase YhbS
MSDGPGIQHAGLTFRSNYFGDRQAFLALAGLLDDTFGIDITVLDRFGGPDPSSMPFGLFDDAGRCIANFSAFSMPLVVDGMLVRAVGYQSGAVRPDYRGRGLYRLLMERAFAWADAQGFEAGILLTDTPDLYHRYGFASVPQYCFRGPLPARTPSSPARSLSLDAPADLALLSGLLETRAAPSLCFSARGQARAFFLNACFDPEIRLSHVAGVDAVVAWKQQDRTLQVLDIVARTMPGLGAVVSALEIDADQVEVQFPTDRLSWEGKALSYRGSCDLMLRPSPVRAVPPLPFMLAPMAEF